MKDHQPGKPASVPHAGGDDTLTLMRRFVDQFCRRSGTVKHPDPEISETVIRGLTHNKDRLGKPLCPCRFYPDKQKEAEYRTWICACDDMQIYKYCHCLLFVTPEGLPITEYLPDDHEGRHSYGVVKDPTPQKGRALKHRAAEREQERLERPS